MMACLRYCTMHTPTTHSLDTLNNLFHGVQKNLGDYMNTSVHCFVIILFTDTYTVILRYDMKCFDQKQKS